MKLHSVVTKETKILLQMRGRCQISSETNGEEGVVIDDKLSMRSRFTMICTKSRDRTSRNVYDKGETTCHKERGGRKRPIEDD